MNNRTSCYSLQDLEHALNKAITISHQSVERIKVIDRQENILRSTFYSEIITCQFPDGEIIKLFCKFSDNKNIVDSHGHRRQVEYEGNVYRLLLQNIKATTPVFYGVHSDLTSNKYWLFIEYLEHSLNVNKCTSDAMVKAARWIGRFHAINEGVTSEHNPWLIKYDIDYFNNWTKNVLFFSKDLETQFPWINSVCKQFTDHSSLLLDKPLTIIHGEYCPNNILVQDKKIYPVDWESAAIAIGEIDLAMLLDGWKSVETIYECKKEYLNARYGQFPFSSFEKTLIIAKIYVQLRWLVNYKSEDHELFSWRFTELKSLSEQLNST